MNKYFFYKALKTLKRKIFGVNAPPRKQVKDIVLYIDLVDDEHFKYTLMNVSANTKTYKTFGKFRRWFHTKNSEFYTFKDRSGAIRLISRKTIIDYSILEKNYHENSS